MRKEIRNNGCKSTEQIGQDVDSWIAEEQLPSKACLQVAKKGFDPYEGMDEDEIEAYKEFRRWFVNKEFDLLQMIPQQEKDDFYIPFEDDDAISFAFGSMDFRRTLPAFSKYHYKLKMIYERIKDLADTHAAISDQKGKENTKKKYIEIVETEFRDNSKVLIESYNKYPHLVNVGKLKQRIGETNSKILKCKDIWNKYAYLT